MVDLSFLPSLQQDLATRGFGGQRFREVYWKRFFLRPERLALLGECSSVIGFLEAADPASRAAFSYVLATIQRGSNLVGQLRPYMEGRIDVLDVGCGFGGFLLAANKHSPDISPHGIELAKDRRNAANALLEDNGCAACVEEIDVFTSRFDALPPMGLIVSENVIEHVTDPFSFVDRLVGKLAPGGTLYLEIPNKHALQLVLDDPHYHLPLITLLPHHSAKALFYQMLKVDAYGMPYDVGEYYALSDYLRPLIKQGLSVHVATRPRTAMKVADLLSSTDRLVELKDSIAERFGKVDAHLKRELKTVAESYLGQLTRDRQGDPTAFLLKYLSPAWCVTATKP